MRDRKFRPSVFALEMRACPELIVPSIAPQLIERELLGGPPSLPGPAAPLPAPLSPVPTGPTMLPLPQAPATYA